MFHLRLPQLLLGLAAVAIIATGIVSTTDRLGTQNSNQTVSTNTTTNTNQVVNTNTNAGYVVQDGVTIYTNTQHGFQIRVLGTYACNAENCPATGDSAGINGVDIFVAKIGTAATPGEWLSVAGADNPIITIADSTLGLVGAVSADGEKLSAAIPLRWESATQGSENRIFPPGSKITVAFKGGKAYVILHVLGLDEPPESYWYDAVIRAFTFTN